MSAITPRKLLASTALAVVFASQAGAAGLASDSDSYLRYHGEFPTALRQAAKDDANPGLHAGGFMGQLESTLKNRTEKPQVVDYPKPVTESMLRTTAVVPPRGMEQAPIPVCAEQNNKVLALWNITAKGEVMPVTNWTGSMVSAGNSAACKDFILAARSDIAAKYAAMQQQQPPSAQTTPPPKQVLGMVTPQQ